jgi:hypothetical protein
MRPEVLGFPLFLGSGSGDALLALKGKGWQRGLLNGFGGGINPGEDPREAMVREAQDEARLVTATDQWQPFARLVGDDFDVRVYCYRVEVSDYATMRMHRQAWERIDDRKISEALASNPAPCDVLGFGWIDVPSLLGMSRLCIGNVPWLVLAALERLRSGRPFYAEVTYP